MAHIHICDLIIGVPPPPTSWSKMLLLLWSHRGRNFKESVVGLAYKGAICYGRYSVGIVQDARTSVRTVGGTATHEMGHILGMSHDDSNGSRFHGHEMIMWHQCDVVGVCECSDPTGKCIMAAVSPSTPSSTWSNCSLIDIQNNIMMYPSADTCVYNEPTSLNFTHSTDISSTGTQDRPRKQGDVLGGSACGVDFYSGSPLFLII